jgi:SP family sugar:H+ symporter-like MFS transporter
MFGWDSMALNVVKNALQYHTKANNGLIGFAIAFGVLSAVLGAFVAGRLSDKTGRKPIMIISAVLFIVSSIGIVFIGNSIGLFLFWRFFSGLAMGAAMTIAPAYISETAPADLRGTLVSLRQFFIIIGLFVCGLLGDWLVGKADAPAKGSDMPQSAGNLSMLGLNLEAWQWAFLSVAIGGIVYLVTALMVPESPRYLVLAGKLEEAKASLGKTTGEDSDELDARIAGIQDSLKSDSKRSGFKVVLTKSGHNLQKVVWVGVALAALQQFVGINAIFYYSTTIFATVGFGEQQALQQTLILTGVKVVAIILGMILIDRIGRRPLMIFGSAAMVVSLIAVSSIMLSAPKAADGSPDLAGNPALGIIALIALCLYVGSYAGTWGPIMWVLVGEMFPNRIRGAATSIAGAAEWIANFAVTLSFPVLAAWSIGTTYIIYGVMALIGLLFVIFLVPETKNVELEDMDKLVEQN